MISINDFLRSKGYDPNNLDDKADMEEVLILLHEYAVLVREEQILLCAAAAACYTSLKVRNVPECIDDDYEAHSIVPRVQFEENEK